MKNNIVNKSKKLITSIGSIQLDKYLTNGIIVIIVLSVIVLLMRKIIEDWIHSIILFLITFMILILVSKNWLVSLVGGLILTMIFKSMMSTLYKNENFENSKEKKLEDLVEKDGEEEDKENIEETPVTKLENIDMDEAAKNLEKFGELLDGGIELKEDDMKETENFELEVKTSKYAKKDGTNALQKAQMESYELMNTIKNLEDTIKTLSPVLNEGKKVMGLFDTFKLD